MALSTTALTVLLALSALLLFLWWRIRRVTVSQDLLLRTGTPLVSRTAGIVGKPDEIRRSGGFYIPVEYKSGISRGTPREWDIAQLLAYCLLTEENMGPVNGGELAYSDASFLIPWNGENRRYLLSVLRNMRNGDGGLTADVWKCRSCEFGSYCGR